jgi:hypothetical protein
MANSSIISEAKNKIIKEFIKDENIVKAINSSTVDKPQDLIYSHIFDYNQNPHTLNIAGTFITIEVSIPETFYWEQTFVKPIVEICITSHEKHMRVENIPKIKQNRNDYLSELIDRKLNGQRGYGIGELKLKSNTAGAYQIDYLWRKMVFEGTDFNKSLCEDE